MGRDGSGVEVRQDSIRITYSVPGQGRRRRTLSLNGSALKATPANLRYAHKLLAEIREKIRHGTFNEADYFSDAGLKPVTVAEQFDTWLASQRIEASTRAGYTSAAKFWKAAIGQHAIRSLLLSHILTAIANRPTLSGKTVNNYVSVLKEALQLAVADRLLAENPADAVPRAKHQKEPPDPFDRGEVDRILADLAAHAPEPVANMVAFWFWTGLRTSEIAGLKWGSVDLSGSMVVSEALVRGAAKANTKTNVARTVKLNSVALAALKRQKAHTYLAGGPVFLDPRYGTPWHEERAFRRSYWEPCLKRLGIRYRRPYCMRHTYATSMLMTGMNPAYCARQLGHSVEVFLSTYARWIDGDRNDAEMARLEATMPQESPEPAADSEKPVA